MRRSIPRITASVRTDFAAPELRVLGFAISYELGVDRWKRLRGAWNRRNALDDRIHAIAPEPVALLPIPLDEAGTSASFGDLLARARRMVTVLAREGRSGEED